MKHINTIRPSPQTDTINVFEKYKGFTIWFDELSGQYMTIIRDTPISSYRIYDLEREIDFYCSTQFCV